MKPIKFIYAFFTRQLRARVPRVQYILFVATVTGIVSGLIAVLLKTLVHYLQNWITTIPLSRFAFLLFPVCGLILTVFIIRRFYSGYVEKGIAMVLKSIARKSSFIPLRHTYIHVFTSSATVGLGGSVGLEAPIVATGSAVGSNVARISELHYRERTLLIACGAAAGIAAVFNAPIAGVIFAIEILLTETIVSYFIPLIISAAIGALCSAIILKESLLFHFYLQQNFNYHNVPFYLLLGILAGFVSLYYARTFKKVEHKMVNLKMHVYMRAVCGGLLLLGLYVLLPPLFGEGYDSIKLLAGGSPYQISDNTSLFSLLEGEWAVILFTGLIVLSKPVAAGITIGSGGNGGNFAPSLFTGAYLGYFFSRIISSTGWFKLPESNFTLVGMAGLLSGVMYCPLTAIFLIAEITRGYDLFIPLMIVSSISYFIVKHFEPYSMDTKLYALEGQIFTHKKDQNILSTIYMSDILEDDPAIIINTSSHADLEHMLREKQFAVIAVVNDEGIFKGIIELQDLQSNWYEELAGTGQSIEPLVKQADLLQYSDSMSSVIKKFEETKKWYLPVISADQKFTGFASQNKLFMQYRTKLSEQNDLYEESNG